MGKIRTLLIIMLTAPAKLFKPNDLNRVFLARIGAEFLRQNRELLE